MLQYSKLGLSYHICPLNSTVQQGLQNCATRTDKLSCKYRSTYCTVYTVNKTKKGHCVNWERLEQSNTRVFTETKISLKIFVRQSFIYREKNNYGQIRIQASSFFLIFLHCSIPVRIPLFLYAPVSFFLQSSMHIVSSVFFYYTQLYKK